MSGNSTSICGESSSQDSCGQNGVYGTQGVASIANMPPSRDTATTWTDASGNLWLFGGGQTFTTNTIGSDICNDVWVFEPTANEWSWMNGAASNFGQSCNVTLGTYGVQGTPATANTPSGRSGAASWTDHSGNLWLFGGVGSNPPYIVDLNELWEYMPFAPSPQPSFELISVLPTQSISAR